MSLEFIEVKIPQDIVKKYLEQKFSSRIDILEYKRLGTGWHGTGYKITFEANGKKQSIVLRTKRPEGFSHDYAADRIASFLIQHNLASKLPKHNKSIDVVGISKRGLVSIGNCNEFFHVVELAEGKPYMGELYEIKKKNIVTDLDLEKTKILSDYLAEIHKIKFHNEIRGDNTTSLAKSIYRRHLRDCIGHGEMLIGVLDTYPDKLSWTNKREFAKIVNMANELREDLKGNYKRLSLVHGDFHPGNILFKNKDFEVLDASREIWGEPADDLTALGINYIWFSIMQNGDFSGNFKKLFLSLWNDYLQKTKDYEINYIAPLFFAFRGVVIAHPLFYKEQSNDCRRKIFKFVVNILREKKFDAKKINSYIK